MDEWHKFHDMKIVVASDSFKGSLSSAEVGEAAASALCSIYPDAEIIYLEVADGGEGTARCLTNALNGYWCECEVSDPLGRPVTARYGISGDTAIIEMAEASGLTLIAEEERDVMRASTFGTGEMILDAYKKGCRNFIIGLGGSATCDCGRGMLEALIPALCTGIKNEELKIKNKVEIFKEPILPCGVKDKCKFTLICDVDNPLYGPDGAAYVFAPQKGATPQQVEQLDSRLRDFAQEMKDTTGRDVAHIPGAGAAGGLAAAFMAYFDCEVKSGVDAVLDAIGFDTAIEGADLVITGEGRMDSQSIHGKLPIGVCRRATKQGIPTIGICGQATDTDLLLEAGFRAIYPVTPAEMSLSEALRPEVARANIIRALRALL